MFDLWQKQQQFNDESFLSKTWNKSKLSSFFFEKFLVWKKKQFPESFFIWFNLWLPVKDEDDGKNQ